MPFVAIDSNVVDLLLDSEWSEAHSDAMEAMELPPSFDGVDDPKLRTSRHDTLLMPLPE